MITHLRGWCCCIIVAFCLISNWKHFKFKIVWRGSSLHIDLCAIEYSLRDAPTALKLWSMGMKRVSIFGIWCENCPLPLPTFRANYWLIKWICWQNVLRQYDFWPSELHEKSLTLLGKICLSSLFSKINWSYDRQNGSAVIWDQKFLLKSDLYLDIKMKVSSVFSMWCIRFWPTIYIRHMMTHILKLTYN